MTNRPILLKWIWISLIIIGLSGLLVLQIRLLWIGVRLEMNQFEQDVTSAIREVQSDLFDRSDLEEQLGNWLVQVPALQEKVNEDSLLQDLQDLIRLRLEEQNINTEFQFAITDPLAIKIQLKSKNFDPKVFRFDSFRIYLGNEVQRLSACECYLNLHINQLFSYLLRQLYYLLIPIIAFFLALFVGFFFLMRQLTKVQQLDQVKNDFINNLTHELNTPTFSIQLATNLLEQQPEATDTYLPLIRRENAKLQEHIKKVLELASLESGKYKLQKEAVNLQKLIAEIANRFQLKMDSLEGIITLDLPNQPIILPLDQIHFSNALQALLDNAIKYNKKVPKIHIECISHSKSIVLKVSDNGIGIPKNEQKHIFKKFYRVSFEDRESVKGFGLGLSYVKQIIELHNGKISIESQLEKGTTFRIEILK